MKIIYDIDDTLWGLNARIAKFTKVDINRITKFAVKEIEGLSDVEKETIIKQYANTKMFQNIEWYKGVSDITKPEKLGAKIYIKSNSMNDEISRLKREQLKEVVCISDDRIQFNNISVSSCKHKVLDNDMDIFVDDSPHNVALSHAKINIMIKCPWNITEESKQIMKDKNVLWFDTLEEVNDYIYNYVLENIKQ